MGNIYWTEESIKWLLENNNTMVIKTMLRLEKESCGFNRIDKKIDGICNFYHRKKYLTIRQIDYVRSWILSTYSIHALTEKANQFNNGTQKPDLSKFKNDNEKCNYVEIKHNLSSFYRGLNYMANNFYDEDDYERGYWDCFAEDLY